MVTLELSVEEARFLRGHLTRHIQQVDAELVRTEKRDLQHALAQDAEHLRNIEQRLAALVARA
ncbi:MAG: hypothetical protein U0807_08515 [Candidatus Binatia bacterium]